MLPKSLVQGMAQQSLTREDSLPSNGKPIQASLRKPREMAQIWVDFLDTVWDEEDCGALFTTFEGISSRYYLPAPQHVRQLLALALSPASCLSSSKGSARRLHGQSSVSFLTTTRKIRLGALRMMESLCATNGAESIFRALPGYDYDETLDFESDHNPFMENTKKRKHSSGNDSDGMDEDDHERPLGAAGNRIRRCQDLWDVLAGAAAKTKGAKSERSVERPVLRTGWEVLTSMIEMWESESRSRAVHGQSALSPSLLRQFKSTSFGPREISQKALRVVFGPFFDGPEKELPKHSQEDVDAGDLEEHPDTSSVGIEDMSLPQKRGLAVRLLSSFAQLCLHGKVDHDSFLREIVMALDRLPPERAELFFAYLDLPPLFTIRICTAYLDVKSRPGSRRPSDLHIPKPIDRFDSSSSIGSQFPPSSPSRRKVLTAEEVASPLESPGKQAIFFRALSPRELLEYLGRVPNELPSPSGDEMTGANHHEERLDKGAIRRPKTRKPQAKVPVIKSNSTSIFSNIAKYASLQRVVKEVLLGSIVEHVRLLPNESISSLFSGNKENIKAVLDKADQEIENARRLMVKEPI